MNRKNLKKLAIYLEGGNLKARFDMRLFTCFALSIAGETNKTNCGTVGCAIGHGPHAGIPKSPLENWKDYSCRVFDLSSIDWDFLFSGKWADVDNTPHGAANRIRWRLQGLSIDSYMKQYVPESSEIYRWIMEES